jgi:carbamoyl-phosphate synthase small subunit
MTNKAYIVLADGQVFEGKRFGAAGRVTGEAVFTTGMTGYLETLTDPSYYGQIVVQTFPLIGNYGVIPSDFESAAPHVRGYVVRSWCEDPSNFRCSGTLNDFLIKHTITGLCGIDTRRLTKIIRESGVMNARLIALSGNDKQDEPALAELAALNSPAARQKLLAGIASYAITNAVESVSVSPAPKAVPPRTPGRKRVALCDYGAKGNITRELEKRGAEVIAVPARYTCDEILALRPDGIMLTNGPGDPAENTGIIGEIRAMLNSGVPIFGICLGHQLMALAAGAKTQKLKYGHRGANQPVKELATGQVYISSQNHGYAVVSETLPPGARLSFINTNDNTCEGVEYTAFPAFSVQFHPEAAAGPRDAAFLFDRFMGMMGGH